jgi:hypothetical protein
MIKYVQVLQFWLPNPGGLVAVLHCLDRSLNQPAPHVLLVRLAEQGPKLLEKASRSKAAAFILNHLADPQGQPKSQIQVALIGHGRPCLVVP